jgi:hypothetical protein
MSKETFTYDELNVGAYEAMSVDVAEGQAVKRGDLLILTGEAFVKDTAGAEAGKVYCVAAEDVDTTDGVKSAIAYFSGKFNKEKVTTQANKGSEYVLAGQGILLVNVR